MAITRLVAMHSGPATGFHRVHNPCSVLDYIKNTDSSQVSPPKLPCSLAPSARQTSSGMTSRAALFNYVQSFLVCTDCRSTVHPPCTPLLAVTHLKHCPLCFAASLRKLPGERAHDCSFVAPLLNHANRTLRTEVGTEEG